LKRTAVLSIPAVLPVFFPVAASSNASNIPDPVGSGAEIKIPEVP
jgi:hypothetical protein